MTILFLFRGTLRGLIDCGDWSVEVSIVKLFYNRIGLKGVDQGRPKKLLTSFGGKQDNDISWFLVLGSGLLTAERINLMSRTPFL
jgi:hypothetical protein